MRRVIALVLAGALVGTACSSDGADGSHGRSVTSSADEYADDLSMAVAALQRTGTEAFEPVELAVAADDLEAATAEAPAASETMTAALDETRATIEQLDPPERYQADQQTVLGLLTDLEDGLAAVAEEAATGDGEVLVQRLDDISRVIETGLVNLSPAIAGRLAVATTVLDEFPELSDDELAYLGAVNAAFLEFSSRNAEFGRALNQSYSEADALLAALVDAGAGTAWAAVRTPVRELTPPGGLEADHERITAYLDAAVAADGMVLAAAEAGDFAGFLVANEELADAARAAMVEVSTPMERAVFPQSPLPPDAVGDDRYALAVWEQMGILADTFLGDEFPGYRPFAIATDEETAAAITEVAPLRASWIEGVRSELAALEIPTASARDHARLLEYVEELRSTNDTLSTVARGGDVAATLTAIEELTSAWCRAGAELNAALGAAVASHLGPTTTDPRCEA